MIRLVDPIRSETFSVTDRYRVFVTKHQLNRLPNSLTSLDLSNQNLIDEDLLFLDFYIRERTCQHQIFLNQEGSSEKRPEVWPLKKLDLSGNLLTKVLDFICLPSLKYLSLANNQLTSVPDFSHLPKLKVLDLSNNQLTEVPDFFDLVNLDDLILNGNPLKYPPMFLLLPSMRKEIPRVISHAETADPPLEEGLSDPEVEPPRSGRTVTPFVYLSSIFLIFVFLIFPLKAFYVNLS